MKTHISFPLILALSLFLTSCTSSPLITDQGISGAQFRLIAMNERELEAEPCGCSMVPRGGFVREDSYLKKKPVTEPNLIYINHGRTFSPSNDEWKKKRVSEYKVKSEYLAKAMKQLKVGLIGLDAGDLLLGEEHLKKIAEAGGFTYLSSDIISPTGLLKPVAQFSSPQGTLYVMSLSNPLPKGEKLPAGYQQLDWQTALAKQLGTIPSTNSFIVVFAAVTEKMAYDLVAKFPRINLIVGSANRLNLGKTNLINANSAWLETRPRGQQLGDVKIKLVPGATRTYFVGRSDQTVLARTWRQNRIAALKTQLSGTKGMEKAKLENEIKEHEAYLIQTEGIEATPKSTDHLVEALQTDLTQEWQIKDSPLEKVIQEMKDKVAQNARTGE